MKEERNEAIADGPPERGRSATEPAVIRLPRRTPPAPQVERPEAIHGAKPGQRAVRVLRPSERRFEREEEGRIRATDRAIAPRTRAQRIWRRVRRVAVGSPLSTEEMEAQRLPKVKALAVFSSDALSSSAYATDEILIVLVSAGVGALTHSIALAGVIAVLLGIVAFSYRQTIKAYPNGGGAYIVARENLGDSAGLIAAASLAVDYVLTVAVSVAAGVLAITSAFERLSPYRVELALGCIGLITLANLRGIRESGTIFSVPTYGFIVSFVVLIAGGFVRVALHPGLHAEIPGTVYPAGTSLLSAFLLLRAFASGCTALTGIEAISNGIPAFKKPESRNAAVTLMWMAAILTTFFVSLTVLAHRLAVLPSPDVSVPAQIGRTVFGEGPVFLAIQAFTALILILAANTSYADFPRLASILARDHFLPHQFTFRGDRLAFSNGIVVLGTAAAALIVLFEADVTKLIPLYAFGVFVSFTLSQGGMVVHWRRLREPGWKASIGVNAFGAVTTAVVAVIVGATKFSHGAWISMLAMGVLAFFFAAISRHYRGVERRLAVPAGPVLGSVFPRRQSVVVPVDEINLAVLQTLDYARTVSANAAAVHVTDDMEAAQRFRDEWDSTVLDIPLVVINSPYRSFIAPFLSYLDALHQSDPGHVVTVVLPEYRTVFPWQRWLHNQSARRLRNELLERPNTVVVEVPYRLGVAPA